MEIQPIVWFKQHENMYKPFSVPDSTTIFINNMTQWKSIDGTPITYWKNEGSIQAIPGAIVCENLNKFQKIEICKVGKQ